MSNSTLLDVIMTDVEWSAGPDRLISASMGCMKAWEFVQPESVSTVKLKLNPKAGPMVHLLFSPDGNQVAIEQRSTAPSLVLLDRRSREHIRKLPLPQDVTEKSVCCSS